ncbi:uncharacterized protein LOC101861695, partial [Aplysia californica]|uniref:Uncharacterized protein LOC101861695 n=1 Tax=Aplysia californica TaxID=6500 RepID=A0ABM0K8E8_APLCA
MIFGDNWISDQWIYSSFPLELDLSFGSKLWQSFNVTFEIIDERIPKCGNTDLTATRVPQRVTSPYYPDFYPSNLTCIWKIRKSSSALINEHMVIEVEANEHKPCQGTDESLVIYHYSDDATISDVLTNIGYCGSRKFYQMYMNGYLEARLTSWIYTVGPGFSFSYFTMERNETCKHEIILSGSNMPYRLSYQILPQYFTGFSYECQWLFKPSASGYAARARNVSVESPAYISRYAVTTDISS